MTLKKKLGYWLPTVGWAGIIFWFSSRATITTTQVYWQDFTVKKTAHVFVYAVLAVLVYRSLKHTIKLPRTYLLIAALLITVLYALTDEFHQSFTPGREPHLRDIVIDAVGAAVSLWMVDRRGIISV